MTRVETAPNIAVCICTRNRPEELRRALGSVLSSSVRPAQIVVSDDSDSDERHDTATVCSTFPEITYVVGPRGGLSRNRNNCLAHVSRAVDAVVFIDDDVVMPPDFLSIAAKSITSEAANTIITGFENRAGLIVTPHNSSFWGHQEKQPRGDGGIHAICINATIFPRSVFAAIQFDDLLHYGYEEIDLCTRAEHAGFRVVFNPRMSVYHSLSPINRDEYSQFQDASRLYTTYKRYRWIERARVKAFIYAVSAPAHLIASVAMRKRRTHDVRASFASIKAAARYARVYASRIAASQKKGRTNLGGWSTRT